MNPVVSFELICQDYNSDFCIFNKVCHSLSKTIDDRLIYAGKSANFKVKGEPFSYQSFKTWRHICGQNCIAMSLGVRRLTQNHLKK